MILKKLVNFIQTPPNAPTPKGWTPIQLATGHGHTEVVKYLVNYSENPIAINPNGWSPIHVAAQKGYLEIVEILSAFTQTPNIPSGNNWTPLQLAAGKLISRKKNSVVISEYKEFSREYACACIPQNIKKDSLNYRRIS